MSGGSDFERDLINSLNSQSENQYKATRFKQHRFSSQLCDVIVLSDQDKYYRAIECKSIEADQERLEDPKKGSEGKLYFSQAFSTNEDGEHQIDRIKEFIDKSKMNGVLAVSIKRGPGKKRLYYGIPFEYIVQEYEKNESTGITFKEMQDQGIELFSRKENGLVKDYRFEKIFQV